MLDCSVQMINHLDTLSKFLDRVVRNPVSANQKLKVNRSINFSSIKMYFTAYDLCGSSLVKLKAEGQTVETQNRIEKLQYSVQNSP